MEMQNVKDISIKNQEEYKLLNFEICFPKDVCVFQSFLSPSPFLISGQTYHNKAKLTS